RNNSFADRVLRLRRRMSDRRRPDARLVRESRAAEALHEHADETPDAGLHREGSVHDLCKSVGDMASILKENEQAGQDIETAHQWDDLLGCLRDAADAPQ